MLRTAARSLAAATLIAVLVIPAVPVVAAPSDDAGWAGSLLDVVAGWLPTFLRATAFEEGETLPNIDPNGLTTGTGGPDVTGDAGEAYPNLDPNGLMAGPTGTQSQPADGQEDTYPNIDPNG